MNKLWITAIVIFGFITTFLKIFNFKKCILVTILTVFLIKLVRIITIYYTINVLYNTKKINNKITTTFFLLLFQFNF